MPKLVEYPTHSFESAIELAELTQKSGSQDVHWSLIAEAAGRKKSERMNGSMNKQLATAIKHGLVTRKGDCISVTHHFIEYARAEPGSARKNHLLATSLLNLPLYKQLYAQYLGKNLPETSLPELLVTRHGVPEDMASRVAKYFQAGLKTAGLLGGKYKRTVLPVEHPEEISRVALSTPAIVKESYSPSPSNQASPRADIQQLEVAVNNSGSFYLSCTGPGFELHNQEVKSKEDLKALFSFIEFQISKHFTN